MIEIIGRPFVIICAFLAILALLVSSASSLFVAPNGLGDSAQTSIEKANLVNTFGIGQYTNITKNYTFLTPSPVSVAGLTCWDSIIIIGGLISTGITGGSGSITTFLDTPTNVMLDFQQQHPPLRAHPVSLYAHQEWGGFLGLFVSSATVILDKDIVTRNYDPSTGSSYTDITLREGYTVIITPDPGTNITYDWESFSRFNFSLAQTNSNYSKTSSGDALQIIGQIMTFSVPNVGGFVNLILAAVLIPTYLILGFFVIRSLIPLLGG